MKRRPLSGREVIKALTKHFGFRVVAHKGSHVKLKKFEPTGERITVVPLHKELAYGTFRGVLKLARITEEDFWMRYK